jgi:hypothetical protein
MLKPVFGLFQTFVAAVIFGKDFDVINQFHDMVLLFNFIL